MYAHHSKQGGKTIVPKIGSDVLRSKVWRDSSTFGTFGDHERRSHLSSASRFIRAISTILCFTLISCNSPASISGQYMHQGNSDLECLTVTQSQQKLSGYVQALSSDFSKPSGYIVKTMRFEGEIDGSAFTLHGSDLEQLLGNGLQDCSGKYLSQGLKLLVPSSNGQTSELAFNRSSAEQWNKAVATFGHKCKHAQTWNEWRAGLTWANSFWQTEGSRMEKETTELSQKKQENTEALKSLEEKRMDAEKKLDLANQNEADAKSNAQSALERLREAAQILRDHPSNSNQENVNKLQSVFNDASSKLNDARYEVQSAKYDLNSVGQDITRVNSTITLADDRLNADTTEKRRMDAMKSLISANKAFFERYVKGCLWVARAKNSLQAFHWPDKTGMIVATYNQGQGLSVIPVGPDWCMILLENKTVLWVQRSDLEIEEDL